MELFAAGDESQWETIKRWIDQSDVFLLFVGVRYGSIDPSTGLSYIENEYRYAISNNKPVIAVYMAEDAAALKITQLGTAVLRNNDSVKLEAFLSEVKKRHCRAFDSLDKIQVEVAFGLIEVAEDERVIGWVRASDVPNVLALEQENATLRKRCADLENEVATRPKPKEEVEAESFPKLFADMKSLPAFGAEQDNLLDAFWMQRDYLLEGFAPKDSDRRWLGDLASLGLVSSSSYGKTLYSANTRGKRFLKWLLSAIASGEVSLGEGEEEPEGTTDSSK